MHWNAFSQELMSIHVWRQTNTQTVINNFYEEDFNILNPKRNLRGNGDGIYRGDFPLMQWIVAGLYKVFGPSLVTTRGVNFIIGLFSVLGMYFLLLYLFNNPVMGVIGAWAFNFSPTFYYYTVNPLPDNLALCFSIWGLAFFFAYASNKRFSIMFLSALLLALGNIIKPQYIIFFSIPFFYFLFNINKYSRKHLVMAVTFFLGLFMVFPFAWYATVLPAMKGEGVIAGVLDSDVSYLTLLNYLIGNLVSVLPELLINYAAVPFFIAAFYFIWRNKPAKNIHFKTLAIGGMLTIAYLVFEINMIKTYHDYYLFPFLPFIFILVAYGAWNLMNSGKNYLTYISYLLLIALPFTAYLRMKNRWNPEHPGFNKDLLTYKDELRNLVPDDALCIVGGDKSQYIYFYYVDKKGWSFDDYLSAGRMDTIIAQGAQYMYSDNRNIDENPEIQAYFDEKLFDKGSIRVYSLKSLYK